MTKLSFFLSFFLCAITLQAQIIPEKPTFNTNSNAPESDFSSEFSCEGMIIHPNDDDFGDDPTSIGKVLIWTKENDTYHTPYQIDKRVVKIEVKFPIAQIGNTVYFQVVDHDDESPYETNTTEPDNYELVGINGVGLHASPPPSSTNPPDPPTIITGGETSLAINVNASQGFKTATCYLVITDRYSGDNYKVEASLDPNFPPGATVVTSNLVAWKRAYLDIRKSYQKGSFISIGGDSNQDNMIELFNNVDFVPEDEIIIFDNDPSTPDIEAKVIDIDENNHFLTLDAPISVNIPAYAGVRKKDDISVVSLPSPGSLSDKTNIDLRLKDAFGYYGNGDDTEFDISLNKLSQGTWNKPSGGTFIEFIKEDGVATPTWKGGYFNQPLYGTQDGYMDYWRSSSLPSHYMLCLTNYNDNDNGSTIGGASSYLLKNLLMVYVELPPQSNIELSTDIGNYMLNTIVHEMGHQFDAPAAGNRDNHCDVPFFGDVVSNDFGEPDPGFTNEHCVMSYGFVDDAINNHQYRNTAEFDSHHNYLKGNPRGNTGALDDSCIEDIRKMSWPDPYQ